MGEAVWRSDQTQRFLALPIQSTGGIRWCELLAGCGTLAVFTADLQLPLGLAIEMLYAAPVLVSLWSPRSWVPLMAAGLSSGLLLLGLLLSPNGEGSIGIDLVNRGFGLLVVWTVLALGLLQKKTEQDLEHARDVLEQRVDDRTSELKAALQLLQARMAEQRRLEEILQANAARFQQIAKVTNDVIYDWDLTTETVWWSEGLTRKFGYVAEHIESKTNWWFERVHPDEQNPVMTSIHDTIRAGQSLWSGEYRFRRADGSYAYVLDRGFFDRDQYGAVVRMVGAFWDISDRKQVEQQLRISEEQHRLLFEKSPHPLWVCDLETLKFLHVNEAATRHYGYSRDEFLSMTIKDIRPPEDIPRLLEVLPMVENSPRIPGEWRHCKKDGTVIDVELAIHNMVYRGRRARLTLVTDVTERKRAEETTRAFLRISEKVSALLDVDKLLDELMKEALALVHAEGGCAGLVKPEGVGCSTYVMRSGGSIPFTYSWALGEGMPGWVLQHKKAYVTNRAATDPQILPEIRNRFHVRTAISTPIIDSSGAIIGFFNVHNKMDGLAFTVADQAKLAAVAHTAAMAIQNALAYKKLKDADAVLTKLLQRLVSAQEDERRRVARELHDEAGQALTSLLVRLKAAEEESSADLMRGRLAELRGLAADILQEMHRLAWGLHPAVLDDLGLEETIRHYSAEFGRAHGIRVDIQAFNPGSVRLPRAVETTLYRIIQEALTNVAKHAEAHTVGIVIQHTPSNVRLIVEDDGRGFDLRKLRENETTAAHLGIYGMTERAALLSGTVTVESTPGQGTTMYVCLPLSGANA